MQLSNSEIQKVRQILYKHLPNVKFWLFGSRIKGTAKHYSDLDIAIISEQPINLTTLSALEEEFAESDLTFKVDLVDWQRISSEFKDVIRKNYVALESQ